MGEFWIIGDFLIMVSFLIIGDFWIMGDFWIIQGVFFDWSPQNFLSTKFLYNLWHLEKFQASLQGIWDIVKFRGDQ